MTGLVGSRGGLIQTGDQVRDQRGRLWLVASVDQAANTATLTTPGSSPVVINRRTGQQLQP